MIALTRLNEEAMVVNAAHIVMVEATPDTIITLYSGEKLIVREPPQEVIARTVAFLRTIGAIALLPPPSRTVPAQLMTDGEPPAVDA